MSLYSSLVISNFNFANSLKKSDINTFYLLFLSIYFAIFSKSVLYDYNFLTIFLAIFLNSSIYFLFSSLTFISTLFFTSYSISNNNLLWLTLLSNYRQPKKSTYYSTSSSYIFLFIFSNIFFNYAQLIPS